MPRLTLFLLLCLFLTMPGLVVAQSLSGNQTASGGFQRDWQFNYNLGFTQFYGDASNNGYFTKLSGESSFGTGFLARKFLSPVFGLGGGFYYTGVKSHKVKGATGNVVDFNLTGSYYDFGVHLYTDLSNLFFGNTYRKVNVYVTLGLGYSGWNTSLKDNLSGLVVNSGDAVNGITTKKSGAVIPFGLGMNLHLSDNWSLNFEGNLRTVMNDDVDTWADGFKYDQLFYTQIGISYYLNRGRVKKPKAPTRSGERPQDCNQSLNRPPLEPIPVYDYHKPEPTPMKPAENRPVSPKYTEQQTTSYAQTGTVYRVQVLAKSQPLPSVAYLKNKLGITAEVFENYQDGVYRYSAGTFATYREALAYSQQLKQAGIHDAFVVVYQNNRRVKLTEDLKN